MTLSWRSASPAQAAGDLAGGLRPRLLVVPLGPLLADVVDQAGEIQDFREGDLPGDAPIVGQPGVIGVSQVFQVTDDAQGVGADGVLVGGVVGNQGHQRAEFGQQPGQRAPLLQPLQGVGNAAPHGEDAGEDAARVGGVGGGGGSLQKSADVVLERPARVQAVGLGQFGGVQGQGGIEPGGVGIGDGQAAAHGRQGGGERQLAIQATGDDATDDAPGVGRSGEIVPHEGLDGGDFGRVGVGEEGGDGLLLFRRQGVARLAGDDVQGAPDGVQELAGLVQDVGVLRAEDVQSRQRGPDARQADLGADLADPLGVLDVAQAPRALLDVRLDGVHVVAAVLGEDVLPLGPLLKKKIGGEQFGAERGTEFAEEGAVAAEEAGVEQGGLGLVVELAHVADQSVGVADLEAGPVQKHVHHHLEHILDDGVEGVVVLVGGHEGEVNVGEGGQFAPPVAAGGDDGEGRPRSPPRPQYWGSRNRGVFQGQREEAAQDGVDQGGVVGLQDRAGAAVFNGRRAVDAPVPRLQVRADGGGGVELFEVGGEQRTGFRLGGGRGRHDALVYPNWPRRRRKGCAGRPRRSRIGAAWASGGRPGA